MSRPAPVRRALALAAAAAAVALGASGCTAALGEQAASGDQKGYVGGNGTYTYVAPADRGAPVTFTGTDASGGTVDLAALRGHVVVVNVWYAGCAPCRAEAPQLAQTARATAAQGVDFVGVNTRDDAASAKAFQTTFSIPYPSVLDASSGSALLALRGQIPPQTVPSTLVLDTRGRPAARYLGELDAGILPGLVQDVQRGATSATAGATAGAAAGSAAGAGA